MKTFQEFVIEASGRERTSMEEFEKLVQKFLPYALKELKIKTIPPLHFKNAKDGLHIEDVPGITIVKDSGFSQVKGTFGQTSQKNRIVVNIENRQPLDALRTLAHELCHYHQHISGVHGTGKTGSSTENEANVRSGIIMRNFDFSHPNVFKLPPL
jgi:Zn-dependent peptidase ImmA (M78 family)